MDKCLDPDRLLKIGELHSQERVSNVGVTLVDIDPNQPETHRKSNPKPVKHLPLLRVKETSEPLYDKLIVMDKLYPSQEAYVVPRIILWAKRSPSRATGEEYARP